MHTFPYKMWIIRNATYNSAFNVISAYYCGNANDVLEKAIAYGIWVMHTPSALVSVMPVSPDMFRVKVQLRRVIVTY
jgi:hypothetical protein